MSCGLDWLRLWQTVAPDHLAALPTDAGWSTFRSPPVEGKAYPRLINTATHRGMQLRAVTDDGPAAPQSWNVAVSGSLPRFLTGSNAAVTAMADVPDGIAELARTFGLDPEQATVTKLEIAADWPPPPTSLHILPRDYIAGLIAHEAAPFTLRHGDNFAECARKAYTVKVYGKAEQLRRRGLPGDAPADRLRAELRASASYLRQRGIRLRRLDDLTLPGVLTALTDRLAASFTRVVWASPTTRALPADAPAAELRKRWPGMKAAERRKVRRYLSPAPAAAPGEALAASLAEHIRTDARGKMCTVAKVTHLANPTLPDLPSQVPIVPAPPKPAPAPSSSHKQPYPRPPSPPAAPPPLHPDEAAVLAYWLPLALLGKGYAVTYVWERWPGHAAASLPAPAPSPAETP